MHVARTQCSLSAMSCDTVGLCGNCDKHGGSESRPKYEAVKAKSLQSSNDCARNKKWAEAALWNENFEWSSDLDAICKENMRVRSRQGHNGPHTCGFEDTSGHKRPQTWAFHATGHNKNV